MSLSQNEMVSLLGEKFSPLHFEVVVDWGEFGLGISGDLSRQDSGVLYTLTILLSWWAMKEPDKPWLLEMGMSNVSRYNVLWTLSPAVCFPEDADQLTPFVTFLLEKFEEANLSKTLTIAEK